MYSVECRLQLFCTVYTVLFCKPNYTLDMTLCNLCMYRQDQTIYYVNIRFTNVLIRMYYTDVKFMQNEKQCVYLCT